MHALWMSDLSPLIFVALFAVGGWLLYPLTLALRRRIEGRSLPDTAVRDLEEIKTHLAELRSQVQGLAGEHDRILELEERLDFAERLLTRGDAGAPLNPGD